MLLFSATDQRAARVGGHRDSGSRHERDQLALLWNSAVGQCEGTSVLLSPPIERLRPALAELFALERPIFQRVTVLRERTADCEQDER